MLSKILGVDLQAVILTMLALVGAYLVLTHGAQVNTLVSTIVGNFTEDLFVLQGGVPKNYGTRPAGG